MRRPPEQIAAARFADQREHQVAVRIEVVRPDQQLAETRLPEVLAEHLRVAPRRDRAAPAASAAWRRGPDPTSPASSDRSAVRCRQRRAAACATRTRPRDAAPAARPSSADAATAAARTEHEQHEPRQPGRQRLGRERRLGALADTPPISPRRRGAPTIFSTKSIGNTISPSATAAIGRATIASDSAAPTDDQPRRRPPGVERARRPPTRQKPLVPEPLRAVDRREQRADRRRCRGRPRGRS